MDTNNKLAAFCAVITVLALILDFISRLPAAIEAVKGWFIKKAHVSRFMLYMKYYI